VIERILFKGNAVIDLPVKETVGAVADPVFGACPAVAVFFDGGTMDGQVGGERGESRKEGGGVDELNAESSGVDGVDAD
jgi:hypothetical protein